uniref:PLAC8 family protein n=1 Tax=Schistocephalus solidus TaxID=70667 RepID=A0A183TUG7_SCHSO
LYARLYTYISCSYCCCRTTADECKHVCMRVW